MTENPPIIDIVDPSVVDQLAQPSATKKRKAPAASSKPRPKKAEKQTKALKDKSAPKASSAKPKAAKPKGAKITNPIKNSEEKDPKPTIKNGKLTLTLKTPTKGKKSESAELLIKPEDDTEEQTLEVLEVSEQPPEPPKKRRKLLFTVKPPDFYPLDTTLPPSIVWQRLSVRDFVIRFEKIVSIPLKHYQSVNNAAGEWDDRLYKSIVLMIFKILYYDAVPVVPYKLQREYKQAIEKTSNNIQKVFALLDEFLYQSGFSDSLITPEEEQRRLEQADRSVAASLSNGISSRKRTRVVIEDSEEEDDGHALNGESKDQDEVQTSTEKKELPAIAPVVKILQKSLGRTDWDEEYRHLYLLNNFIVLASQTETIRSSVTSCTEALKTVSKTYTNDMAKIDASFNKQLEKIRDVRKELSKPGNPPGPRPGTTGHHRNSGEAPKTKKAQLAELAEREAQLRQTKQSKILKAKETQFFMTRRFTPKTVPLGMDYFGNTYWHFQQKSKELKDFGFWIIIEKSRSVPFAFGLAQFLPKSLGAQYGEGSMIGTGDDGHDDNTGTAASGKRRKFPVGELYSDTIYGNGQGSIFYMKITHSQVQALLDWLEYQKQVSLNPTSRTRKLLARDSSADNSFEGLVAYVKQLKPFADEDEVEEEEKEEESEESEGKNNDDGVDATKEEETTVKEEFSANDEASEETNSNGVYQANAHASSESDNGAYESQNESQNEEVSREDGEDQAANSRILIQDSGSELSDLDSDAEGEL